MNQIVNHTITLDHVRQKRDEILQLAKACGAVRVRVFGSVARGEATNQSDVDFLVQFNDDATMWEIIRLWRKLGELLNCEVSVIPETEPKDLFMQNALRDAVEL
ncbi:MAG: nucleotidyltransferase domain-containing protein [Anaerolineae bacterium]|nr:nucleotidyltransferase domain-containing protein [Anaerolineae bacterium]